MAKYALNLVGQCQKNPFCEDCDVVFLETLAAFKQNFHEIVRHGTDRTSLLPTKNWGGGGVCWGGDGGGGRGANRERRGTTVQRERKASESGAKRVQTRANGVRNERTTT
jgi:hypothetical protein